MHPGAVLGGQEEGAQLVVRVVEKLAQATSGGKRRDVDVDADEAEQLVVVESGGTRALNAGEQQLDGWRRRSRRGIGRGCLGPHRGGERGIVWHGGSVVDKASLIPYGNEPEGLGVSQAVGDVGIGLSGRQMLS